MEMAAGIPVVRSSGSELLRIIPGSQETSLFSANLEENRNDMIFSAIRRWADAYYGRDIVAEQLGSGRWPRVCGEKALIEYVNSDRKRTFAATNAVLTRMQRLQKRLASTEAKVSRLEEEVSLLRNSSSYRLGNTLVSPLSRLRGKKDGTP